ncbi:MAG: hypothetical protein WAK93_11620 [Solirubrobacteraceae bacterium]
MGLLDDAIREHLDLKRRRGADPAEVERDEREALGPVRRNPPANAATADETVDPEAGFAYDQAEEEDWAFDPEDGAAARPSARDEADSGFGYDDAELDDELEPLDEDPRNRAGEELGGATVEYDVQAELHDPPSEPAEDDDVLEETPEFLQDTPEHDRLWFEQRPPKDFDFDG